MKIIGRIIRHAIATARKVYTPLNRIDLWLNDAAVGRRLETRGKLHIRNDGELRVGHDVRINSAWWANTIGVGERTVIQIHPGARIVIGDRCGISNAALIAQVEIVIGDDVLIGSGCRVYDTDFHPIDLDQRKHGLYQHATKASVHIKRGAFIGAGTVVLKGVTIGEGAVIGADSVVAKSIPDNEIWAGNPARFIRIVAQKTGEASPLDRIGFTARCGASEGVIDE